MILSAQVAKHFREVYFGGNWTTTNLRDTLTDITWQQATSKVFSFNTIATLTYHIHYFTAAVLKVLEGNPLDAHDKYSFSHPPINSDKNWEDLLSQCWAEAARIADLIGQLPENRMWDDFEDKKYGNYYRNITGVIEHAHYHLGQIILIKGLLLQQEIVS